MKQRYSGGGGVCLGMILDGLDDGEGEGWW